MDGLGLIGLGRWAWSIFWALMAVACAVYILTKDETLGVTVAVLLCTSAPFLFLALSGRFLFTGEWRRPRKELGSDSVLSPRRQIGSHESTGHILPSASGLTGKRGIGPQDRI